LTNKIPFHSAREEVELDSMRPAHSTHADLALVDHQTGLANGVQTQESPGVRQQGNEGDEADQQGVTDLLALVTLTLSCPIGPAAGFPAMSSNVPFLMKDVILLAVSLDLLRQVVAARAIMSRTLA
jgi:hypothetical protein